MNEETICMTALETITNYTRDAWEVAKDSPEEAARELMFVRGVCALTEDLLKVLKEEVKNYA